MGWRPDAWHCKDHPVMNTFHPGQTVWLEIAGERCEILELIGSGGQGQVYRASLNGQDYALKWYFPTSATREQRAAIERLVHKGDRKSVV